MKLELYLGHISIKAALFGSVQQGCCQNKVWQRQIKKPLYQPREAQNGVNPFGIISCVYPPLPPPQYLNLLVEVWLLWVWVEV